jgi:hypothetical protein
MPRTIAHPVRWLTAGLLVASTAASLVLNVHTVGAQSCRSASLQSLVDNAQPGSTLDVPACTYHEQVNIAKPLTLDGHGKTIVDGDNTRSRWFWIAADHVTIRGFTARNAATPNQSGAIQNQEGIGWLTIENNDLGSTAGGEQIGITTTHDSRVTGNDIHDGGQMAIGTYLNQHLLIQGNHIHGNNTANVDPFWAAGGMKIIGDTDLQVLDNEVDHNQGPGIWCDIGCNRVLIARNRVHDQPYNPIFYEISSNGEITGNTIATSTGGGVWGCIVVSSSGSTYVHANTCTDSAPLRAQLETRSDRPADAGTGVRLEGNQLIRPTPDQATSWWQQDPNGPLVPGQNGNTDVGNVVGATGAATPTPVPATPPPAPGPTSTPAARAPMSCTINIAADRTVTGFC